MISLIFFVLICLAVGFTGSCVTTQAIPEWYSFLNKPYGTPPDWVFAPVWTTLYVLMAVAVWRIWRKRSEAGGKPALILFAAQLFLNALWTPVFFGARDIALGFAVILALWLFIFLTIRAFFKIEKFAACFLIPYILWVSYAVWLNAGIWKLN